MPDDADEAGALDALALPRLPLGVAAVKPPDEDFDRDRSDRREILWVGVAIVVVGILFVLLRALR
jgi:hypothetical protein